MRVPIFNQQLIIEWDGLRVMDLHDRSVVKDSSVRKIISGVLSMKTYFSTSLILYGEYLGLHLHISLLFSTFGGGLGRAFREYLCQHLESHSVTLKGLGKAFSEQSC